MCAPAIERQRFTSTAYRLLFTVYRLPLTVYRLPSTVYRLPSTVYRLPSTVYRLPSTVYRLPFTTLLRRRLLARDRVLSLQSLLVVLDGLEQRLRDLLAVGAAFQQRAILPVGDERDLRQHARHYRADQDDEGRLLDAEILERTVLRAEPPGHRLLHGDGEVA